MTHENENRYWQAKFRRKMTKEYNRFKKLRMKEKKKVVYDKSYQIDCYIRIYERLIEMSETLSTMTLITLCKTQGVLDLLYATWMKTNDSSEAELYDSMILGIGQIMEH